MSSTLTLLERLEAALGGARALVEQARKPAAPVAFTWNGIPLRLDRDHLVAVPQRSDPEAGLRSIAGPRRRVTSEQLVRALAHVIAPPPGGIGDDMGDIHLFNLAVIQPMINPAILPLFWVALAQDRDGPASGNLYPTLGPLLFDMSDWPASRAEGYAVRLAQIGFVRDFDATFVGTDAETLDDLAWAARCRALVDKHAAFIERVLLDRVAWEAR